MELLSAIIKDLLSQDTALTDAILKTKYFASKIKNTQLLAWANNELNGYVNEIDLPYYRKNIVCHVYGNYINGNMQYTEHVIPVTEVERIYKLPLNKHSFYDSVHSLENLITEKKNQKLQQPFNAETVSIIERTWRDLGNPYLRVVSAHKIITQVDIKNILIQTRSKLLDFMIEIESEYGQTTNIKDLINKSKEIEKIMNKTIINNYGDGNISNTGNDNKIEAKINITKNSSEELKDVLLKNGINQTEIDELVSIIDNDNHDIENKKFGSLTNSWYQKMIGKTLDGTWSIATGAAAGVLTDVINQYLGF